MSWQDMRPWGIKLRYVFLVAIALMLYSHPPKSCQGTSAKTVHVAAGDLARVYPTLAGAPFNVAMKNGATETSRNNDIEELAKDWHHFKKKAAAGDAVASKDFQQTNVWLSRYNDADVHFMIETVGKM